jgi:hypothetical protein
MGRFQSGQMGRTVNPLSFDFSGSNPLLPTLPAVALAKADSNKGKKVFENISACAKASADKSGSSSVGRATAFQAVGRGFEPRLPLSKRVSQKSQIGQKGW